MDGTWMYSISPIIINNNPYYRLKLLKKMWTRYCYFKPTNQDFIKLLYIFIKEKENGLNNFGYQFN